MLSLALLLVAQSFTPAEKAELDRGEVLVKRVEPRGGEGVAAKAVAVVRAAPDKVWATVNDCAGFQAFMPNTKRSEPRNGGKHCFVEVSLPFPFSNLWSETRVEQVFLDGGGRRRQWTLVEGTYRRVEGSWTVLPWGEGHSLLLYAIDVDPDVALPDAILRSAQTGALPDVFAAIRKRSGA